jgi:hypothetical protein
MNTAKMVVGSDDYNCQLLYFTSSSLLKSDEMIFFISDKTGSPNIFVKNLFDETETKLSNNTNTYMKSYVYFDGELRVGLGKASVSLDANNNIVYYILNNKIMRATLDGDIKILAELPQDQMTAFTHISSDGKLICVPTVDIRALDYETAENNQVPYNIDMRVQEESLNSYIRVFDTESGEEVLCEKVNKAWITHVQFSPIDNNLILYNHEWPAFNCGIRRMWLFDGKNHIPLRNESENRSRNDWTCHEMWSSDGKSIIYHGKYENKISYIGKINIDDLSLTEISIQDNYKTYGHFTISNSGELVSDGYFELDDKPSDKGEYISLQKVDWENKKINWIPLCKHNSSWKSQDAHPHPIFNHKGDKIYYTSDVSGKLQIYCVNTISNK